MTQAHTGARNRPRVMGKRELAIGQVKFCRSGDKVWRPRYEYPRFSLRVVSQNGKFPEHHNR